MRRLINAVLVNAVLAGCAATAAQSATAADDPALDATPNLSIPPEADSGADSGRMLIDGVETFTPVFFQLYNPVTASDMVARVPGFSVDNGADRRGFGATAGNVLINGERPSSKSNVSDVLGRIAATNVARIEVIRGGNGAVDVRGQSQLVNVVLVEGAAGVATTTYEAQLRYNQAGRTPWYIQASRNFTVGNADITLDVVLPSNLGRAEQDEYLFDPAGDLVETRDEFNQENYRDITLTGAVTWRPSERDTLSFNAKAYPWLWTWDEVSIVSDPAGAPLRTSIGHIEETEGLYTEFGGDWERRLSDTLSVKIIGLNTLQTWATDELFETSTPAGFDNSVAISQEFEVGERIGRTALTWRATDAHTIEVGLEAAFNYRDSTFDLFRDTGAGPQPVALPVSNTRVEELRGEVFVTDVWQVSPKFTVEGGFTFEASRITQTGDAAQQRELSYPKPRLTTAYTFEGGDQLRFTFERDVSQLDFGDFASTVSQSNGTTDIGNPNLEPERSWRTRAEWERRLGDRGAITVAAFHDRVQGVSGLVLLDDPDPTDDNFPTGPGNLGDGTRTGVEIESTIGLDWIGLTNATLKINGTRQHTEVTDPITGVTRPFQRDEDWDYHLDFRQDLPRQDLAWGWDYGRSGSESTFRANQTQVWSYGPGDLDMFIETTRFDGMTVRFGVDNIFDQDIKRQRVFYDGLRSSGIITGREQRDRNWGQLYRLSVSGTF